MSDRMRHQTVSVQKENPIDIYTAVKFVSPGQKIVLLSGTYNLESTVTVQPGIDGTESQPIIMAAESSTDRPVFDFGKNCEGMVLAGDHWYYQGFDVTNSANAKDGIRLCGSSCTVDNVRTYHNVTPVYRSAVLHQQILKKNGQQQLSIKLYIIRQCR